MNDRAIAPDLLLSSGKARFYYRLACCLDQEQKATSALR